MQIERIGTPAVTAASKTQPTSTEPAASSTSAAGATPQAQPLSGGSRTVSPALLTEAETDTQALPSSFADLVVQKNQELATALKTAFEGAKISTADPIKLTLDSSGAITTSDGRKEKVEKLFKENPELAKQFKDAAALNTLLALNSAMRLFNDATKNAKTDEQRNQAQTDYIGDTMAISSLGKSLVLSNGVVESPAVVYMGKRIANG